MDLKRILTAVLGLPLVIITIIFGNKYLIDTLFTIIAIICMHEYLGVIEKVSHPIKWIAYLSTLGVSAVSFLEQDMLMKVIVFSIPIIILILFLHVIFTNMKTTIKDAAYTFMGIFYVTFFIMCLSLIRCTHNGKAYIGYIFVVAWTTDIFAYLIGKKWGKHKFSKVSPKKSIEGCISGTVGSVICSIIYIMIISRYVNIEYSYLFISIMALILSLISQIGDFVASSIKRFADVKDYGNLLPGHGGMLDRIDSLIFIAPFLYMFLVLA